MMKLLTAAVLLLALCFLPHRVVAQCVGNYHALEAAIRGAPTTDTIGGADPPVIELCGGTIDFSISKGREIGFTDRHFDLICPQSETCALDGNDSMQLFKAGRSSASSSHEVTFQNIHFIQGYGGRGGAIEVWGGTTKLDGCTFKNNLSGRDGGAFYGRAFKKVTITQCKFENSTATNDGGALFVRGSSGDILNIADSTFMWNLADNRGGAIYSNGPNTTIIDSTFSGNTANGVSGLGRYIYKQTGFVVCIAPSNTFCDGFKTNKPKALCGTQAGPSATYLEGGCLP